MFKTIVRRVLVMIPQLIILSVLVFMIAKLLPGDPFSGLIDPNLSYERILELKEQMGLNDPWYIQYINWVKNLFHGDLGQSYLYKLPVVTVIGNRIGNTFLLSLLTTIVAYSISIPFGILSGRYTNSKIDKAITLYNFITFSIPTFVLGILTLWLFAYKIPIFPSSGSVALELTPGTFSYYMSKIHHALLPALTGGMLSTVGVTRYLRNEIIDSKYSDYVKTARSKGIPENKVYRTHIIRNSLVPIAAFLGYTIVGLLAGSVFLETIFGYPGMGQLFIQSISGRDYSVVTVLILFYGMLSLIGTLLSDIILSIVDPRIRIQ